MNVGNLTLIHGRVLLLAALHWRDILRRARLEPLLAALVTEFVCRFQVYTVLDDAAPALHSACRRCLPTNGFLVEPLGVGLSSQLLDCGVSATATGRRAAVWFGCSAA